MHFHSNFAKYKSIGQTSMDNIQIRKPQKMDIMSYFRTTNKGIYLMSDLPATSSLNRMFFGMSLGLQIIFMLLFVGIFGLSIFRAVKKIKNSKFKTEKEEEPEEEEENVEDETNAKETNDNLIYRFDEEDHEKEKKFQGEDEEKKGEEAEENSEDEYEKEHDENQERFLEIDNQILFLQPFLIGSIVCNGIFATNVISLICIATTVLLFLIFNIKGACSNVKWLSLLFMLPALGSFVPVFLNDHNMST